MKIYDRADVQCADSVFRYVLYDDSLTKIAQLVADNDRMIDELTEKDKHIAKINKEFACFSEDLKHASIIKIKERERKIYFLEELKNQDRETYTSTIRNVHALPGTLTHENGLMCGIMLASP